jgi:hypothetical protein
MIGTITKLMEKRENYSTSSSSEVWTTFFDLIFGE